jgi:hypothetical protein
MLIALLPTAMLIVGCEVLLLMEPGGTTDPSALTLDTKNGVDVGDDNDGPGGFDVPEEASRAYFVLRPEHLRESDWPSAYVDYDLFVCAPSISSSDFQAIRSGVPGATLLAYTNLQDITIGPTENPYYQELNAVFDSTMCVTDLHTGHVVRVYGRDPAIPGSGVPSWIVGRRSADVLAEFHRDVTMPLGWDGLYIDNCTRVYPNWRKTRINSQTDSIDVDEDGVADTWDQVDTIYGTWRPYFTERLREYLGASAILVGNAGGPLGDPQLNGITLESIGTRFTIAQGRQYFTGQSVLAASPRVNVAWIILPGDVAPTLTLAQELSNLWVGEVIP